MPDPSSTPFGCGGKAYPAGEVTEREHCYLPVTFLAGYTFPRARR